MLPHPHRVVVCIFVTCIYVADGHVSYAAPGTTKIDHVTVKTRAFPYVTAIFDGSEFLCTGALVNKQLVITAASPFNTLQGKVETLTVRLGSKNKRSGGVKLSVAQLHVHPSHKPGLPECDVAVLTLSQNVITSPSHSAIATGTKKCSPKQFYSAMWYKGGDVEGDTDTLRTSWYAVADRRWCRWLLSQRNVTLTNNISCLRPHSGHVCLRDAGAPLVDVAPRPTQLWGVVSPWTSPDCGTFPSPVLATRLTAKHIREWLQTYLKASENTATTRPLQLG